MPLSVLIADDDPLIRRSIRALLEGEPDVEVVKECADGRQVVAALSKITPDVVFLDVQMPDLDAFGVVDAIGVEHMPALVLVTAHEQYAVRAFQVHAIDYLVKPFSRERFRAALQRARSRIAERSTPEQEQQFLALLEDLRARQQQWAKRFEEPGEPSRDRLLVRSGEREFFVRAGDVRWIGAEGNYARLHLGAESYLVRDTMNSLEERLDARRFARVHRSTIVNLDQIRELRPRSTTDYVVVLSDGTRLRVSRGYRERLERQMKSPR